MWRSPRGGASAVIVGIVAIASLLLIAGCASQRSSSTPTPPPAPPAPTATPLPTVPPDAPEPVVWRIGLAQDITTTNVWAVVGPQATAWNFYVLLNRYPTLYRFSDGQMKWVPLAADGFPAPLTQNGDGWTATVSLKDGLLWSDGEPVTARDVAFTINTALEFGLPGNWKRFADPQVMESVEAVDERTVRFVFKARPGLARWQYGAAMAPIVPEHFWAPLVQQARAAATPDERQQALLAIAPDDEPTAGEMVLSRREPGAFVELAANGRYFFADSRVTQYANGAYLEEKPGVFREEAYGQPGGEELFSFTRGPHAASVIFSVYPTQDAAVLALQRGEIDYFVSPTGLQRGFQQQLASRGDVQLIENSSNNVNFLGFNQRRAPMDNAAFRQAVAVLIDREFVAQSVLQGAVDPAYSFVPEANVFWHNPDVAKLGRGMTRAERLEEAVRLLTEAGFTFDSAPAWDAERERVVAGSGLRMPDGTLVPGLEILCPNMGFDPFLATFAIWTERWLQEAGIPARLTFASFNNVVIPRFFQQDLDMWLVGLGLTVFPDYMRDFLHSDNAMPGNMNAAGYASAAYDAFADDLVQAADLDAARQAAFGAQAVLNEDVPFVFLYSSRVLEPVRSHVRFPFTEALGGMQNGFQSMNGPLSYTGFQ